MISFVFIAALQYFIAVVWTAEGYKDIGSVSVLIPEVHFLS